MPTSRYPCTQQRRSQDGLSINQNQDRILDISCSKTRNLNLSPHAVLGATKSLEFEISHSLRTESLPSDTLHSKVRTDPTRLPFASSLRKVYTCSKEDIACCSCHGGAKDAKLRAFDHRNAYQVMEIKGDGNGKFTAKSVAPDGHPPSFLGREHWKLHASKPKHCALREAWGLDAALRPCLPDLNFPIAAADGPKITVGRWYCPFMFVKEACRLRDQMKRSMFYEISLEQFWQKVYACENHSGHDKVVEVNALFGSLLVVMDGGKEVVQDRTVHGDDGMVWFRPLDSSAKGIGLSLAVWERIRWEQGRGGWIADEEERMVRLEQHEGTNRWKKFACYVLVERFVVKRMDGSSVLTFDFRHSIKVRSKWE
ncbi:ATPase family associated with various cellular activities (AAA) [Musa troglodytarum]|uniref:ATPase family associated with various cellular activities (AAA) n=1 Tax=Musa troglodytarum TaxID=320322 RepID=A0A9E7HVV6_9LILI|nr:ATPase family associated with various cellular activities (AAA) [Musa troglodytarum]